ncbi:calcium-binding protein [Inquilinus sp. NPDC058860]|uniref:calcium-binding protein n=1 Tax=Inquilinus sp. NPDC058860 TaxID=3346652 RepID=UPI003691941F
MVNQIYGTPGDDVLIGTDDVDEIYGFAGDDSLQGGDGNDTLGGDSGADTLSGGAGIDTAGYSGSSTGVTVTLGGSGSGGDAQGDTIAEDIENLRGSDYADILTGNAEANILRGSTGNDVLRGEAGDDVLFGYLGADAFFGGDGIDTVDYSDTDIPYITGATVTIGGTGSGFYADGDTIADDIENLIGTEYEDVFVGNAGANTLRSGGDDDVLNGNGGADTLDGGAGFDLVSYYNSAQGVTVNLAVGTGSGGTAEGDTLISVEAVYGSSHADTLTGGDGDDVFRGGAGADDLDGGAGTDVASYADSTVGVTVNLATGTGSSGTAFGDTLVSIENIHGSGHADTLTGSAAANIITGARGKDLLTGGDGADRFVFAGSRFASHPFDSAVGRTNADRITDFSHVQGDRIDLSAINADSGEGGGNGSFTFIGTAVYTGVAGQLRYALSGSDAVIGGDVDGDGVSDFNIVLSNVGSLQASDFVL